MATFLIKGAAVNAVKAETFNAPENNSETTNNRSYLGTPLFSYVEFPEGQYKTLDGDTIKYDGVRIETVLVEMTQSKNIVTTQIQGRNGTIKEYVSDGDYQITLTGKLVNKDNAIPEVALTAFKEICKVPDTLEIVCPFLQYFDVTAVVITEYTITEAEGYRNVIDFSLTLLSDTPKVKEEFVKQPKQESA